MFEVQERAGGQMGANAEVGWCGFLKVRPWAVFINTDTRLFLCCVGRLPSSLQHTGQSEHSCLPLKSHMHQAQEWLTTRPRGNRSCCSSLTRGKLKTTLRPHVTFKTLSEDMSVCFLKNLHTTTLCSIDRSSHCSVSQVLSSFFFFFFVLPLELLLICGKWRSSEEKF